MSKKRKTRNQKVVARLRRQLASHRESRPAADYRLEELEGGLGEKNTLRQVAADQARLKTDHEKAGGENHDLASFSYDPSLVKRDIFKTLALSLAIIMFELVLYFRLS